MRRVPLIVQGSNTECGAAALAMVATFHGHHLTLLEASRLCEGGRDGASAAALARAVRGIGLEVKAYRAQPEILSQITLPAIAHWGANHYVVVERVRGSRVDVVDPDRGRRSMGIAEFAQGVGKVLLAVTPGPDFRPRRPAARPFWRRYLSGLLKLPGSRSPMLQLLAVTAVVQLFGLALPLAAGVVTDRIVPADSASVLAVFGAGIAAIGIGQFLAGYLRSALIVYLQGRLDTQAMIGFAGHLLRLPLSYFHRRSTGDIIMRVNSIASLRELVTAQSLAAALDIVTIAVYLVIIGVSDLLIAAVIALVIAVQAILLLATMRAARDRMSAELAAQSRVYGHMTEAVEGITTLKASAAEAGALARWTTLFVTWIRAVLRRGQLSAITETASSTLRTFTPLVVLLIGAARVVSGDLSLGTAMALTWLAAAVVVPLSVLAANGQRLQLAGAQLQRLADVLDNPPEHHGRPEPAGDIRVLGRIELRDVSFAYDSYSPPVLEGVTLTVEPGTRLAIAGASGSGKTTLAMLILGLYQPTGGTVHIDGHSLATPAAMAIRAQTGTVLQEPYIFSGTIAENITFHDATVPQSDIERAATLAGLHDDIVALPQGYATRLAERGSGLSGGQRQRLAIARALLRRPRLLLLDEATSHLDTVAEARVHTNLSTLDCTRIVVAHRLSTIRDADAILVLHKGKIAEHGTHSELIAAGGRYASLVAAQLNGQADNTGPTGDMGPAGNGAVLAAPSIETEEGGEHTWQKPLSRSSRLPSS